MACLPRYQQVAEQLQARRQALGAPLRLPDEHLLAAEHGVGRDTIRRALQWLEARQAVTRRPRRGTFLQPLNTTPATLLGATVGFVPPWWAGSLSQWLSSAIFEGLSRWADEHHCLIHVLHDRARSGGSHSARRTSRKKQPPQDLAAWRQRLEERQLAGLIWAHPQQWQWPLVEAAAENMPTVVLGRPYPESPLPHVMPDYNQAACLIDDYFAARGHRHYTVIGKNALEPYMRHWLEAFTAAQQRRGLRFDPRQSFLDLSTLDASQLATLLLKYHRPTSALRGRSRAYMLLTSSYLPPLVAHNAFRTRMEKDLSIVTWDFGTYPMAAYWPGRKITHVTCNWDAMGQQAMEILARVVAHSPVPKVTCLPVGFEPGQTVHPA